jgi:imidazolonepropionase-like amidohydrolase
MVSDPTRSSEKGAFRPIRLAVLCERTSNRGLGRPSYAEAPEGRTSAPRAPGEKPLNQVRRAFTFLVASSLLGVLLLGALLFGTPLPASAPVTLSAPANSSALVLDHVTVIDVSGGPARADQIVVIAGDKITAVGKSGSIKTPMGAQVIDARGKFLIPGLWDMHTHIAGISANPSWARQVLIPLLVANGITGIRDMGGDLDALKDWRLQIAGGAIGAAVSSAVSSTMLGPRIVAAGPMLVPPRRASASGAEDPAEMQVGTPEEARAAVDQLQQRGADFVKIIDVPRDAYFAVAEESKARGISFAGHIPADVNAVEASNAGQKSIEHIIYSSLAFDCSSQEAQLRKKKLDARVRHDGQAIGDITDEANRTFSPEKAATLWATFKKNGTWVTPTLFSIRANARRMEDSAGDPQLAFLPAALRKEWAPPQNATQDDRDTAAWWQRQFENDRKLTGEMHRAGVRLLAGSDSLDRYVFVGTSLHQELQQLVAAGLTPLESLQAATKNPAEFLGRKDLGAIVVGNRADMVLLEADPLQEISNTQKISVVILAGKFLARADLDQMLANARAAAAVVTANGKN